MALGETGSFASGHFADAGETSNDNVSVNLPESVSDGHFCRCRQHFRTRRELNLLWAKLSVD